MKIEQMVVYRVEDMIFDTMKDAAVYINKCSLRGKIEGLIKSRVAFTDSMTLTILLNEIMLKIDAAKGVE